MPILIKDVRVLDYAAGIDSKDDVLVDRERLEVAPKTVGKLTTTIDGKGLLLVPGLVDLHVHFRDPGFFHKEDIFSGIRAALAGGVTSALVMPNTSPCIDEFKKVYYQLNRAQRTGFNLMVAGAASKGLLGLEPSDIAGLKRASVKAVTDDGKPILDSALMEKVLRACRMLDLICMQHAEDLSLSHNAPINDGKISKKVGMTGQSVLAEANLIERDLRLAHRIGARYHVLHLSCLESLQLIRQAKRKKMQVTCEVAPHHLLLNEGHAAGLDTCKKMNPPLRRMIDVDALIEGLNDGSIDAVASDHAPHAHREKRLPFLSCPFGVVGLETSILVLLTLVNRGKLSLKRAIEAVTTGPAKVLGESHRLGTMMSESALKNAVLIDPNYRRIFSARNLFGRSKNSPFIGMELSGRVMATFLNGELVYSHDNGVIHGVPKPYQKRLSSSAF